MALGEVLGSDNKRYELQLKGCGRSPYSRQFDGRAVLRSCIREYLVSEAMHHLGVPTTRALSVVRTGQTIRRPWYGTSASAASTAAAPLEGQEGFKYSPDRMLLEPGAVMCRVSTSFLRFAQLELFAKREEFEELIMLANYVCLREYPHLLNNEIRSSSATAVAAAAYKDGTYRSSEGQINLENLDLKTPGPPERYVELYREVRGRNNKRID
jgi:uncharacterized protein YdiU (UPF0061 family)